MDRTGLRSQLPPEGSICLVTPELAYLHKNGGVGTATWLLAHALAEDGWYVHVLYAGRLPDSDTLQQTQCQLRRAGIGLTLLEQRKKPRWASHSPHGNWHVGRSEWVDHVLGQLHQEHRFDLVEFPELGATGFRPIQAKRTRLAYHDVELLVKLHSSNQWCREANRRWMHSSVELLLDHAERYCFEQADRQLSPCRYMLDYAAGIGWQVRDQAEVVPYVYPLPLGCPALAEAGRWPEVVFFGRLETRKGLEVFLRAVRHLDPAVPVTFLGSSVVLTGGMGAVEYVRQQLGDRPVRLLTDLNQEQALRYLLDRPRLAVIPSLMDNYPNTVIECVVHRVPFVATRVGGIPEIVADADLQRQLLCDPTPEDLLRCLNDYLQAPVSRQLEIHDRLAVLTEPGGHNRRVVASYRDLLARCREARDERRSAPGPTAVPAVTVAVSCPGPDGLAQTLAALRGQTHANLDVVVLQHGTGNRATERQEEELRRLYPQVRWQQLPGANAPALLQSALEEARGEYFLPLEAGTVAHPRLLEKLVRGLEASPRLAGLSCYALTYRNPHDLAREKFVQAHRPTGGTRLLGCLENVFGQDAVLFRTASLCAVGGFDLEAEAERQGWLLAVKLLHYGHGVDVLPDYLCCQWLPTDPSREGTNVYLNQRHIVREYVSSWQLTPEELCVLWSALSGTHQTYLTQSSRPGRLARLRQGMERAGACLGGLIPLPGRCWLWRAVRGLAGWGRWLCGRPRSWDGRRPRSAWLRLPARKGGDTAATADRYRPTSPPIAMGGLTPEVEVSGERS